MRAARPGEFTLRAFLAGKLDLTQAEAVLAVIAADSSDELKRALTQLAGGLGQPLRRLREDLLGVLAEVEAGLDFSDEDLSFISTEQLRKRLAAARRTLIEVQNQIHERGTSGRAFRVVFAGPPNAGKSSLFNALLGQSAALVSPIAGTTRDYLMGTMTIDGMKIELIDTAGADTVSDTIMAQAQSGREQQLTDADLVIECRAADLIHTPADLIHTPDANPARCISVQTKADLSPGNSGMRTSVVTGEGLEPLRETIAQRAKNERRPFSLAPSLSRCSQHVTSAVLHLENAAALTADSGPPELLAFELRLALDQIGEMVGAVYADDLLDRIFSQFCIGK
jgi:tRNA modification GTPase